MSLKLTRQVWKMTMTPIEKFVLLALADYANDDGECWPSQAALAEATGYSERRVKMAIQWLRENGHLSAQKDKRNKNTYRLSVGNDVHGNSVPVGNNMPLHGEQYALPVGNNMPHSGERGAPPYIVEPTNEPPIEPTKNHQLSCQLSAGDAQKPAAPKPKQKSEHERDPLGKENAGFCAFYALWPRRVQRKDAFRAYLKQVKTPALHQMLIANTTAALAGLFAFRPLDKMPHPATWINSLDWQDDTADLSDPTPARGIPTQRYHKPEVQQGFDYDILGSGDYSLPTGGEA